MSTGYDLTFYWSPQGEIEQAGYANECIKNSRSTILAVKDNVCYILVRKIDDILTLDEVTNNKIVNINEGVLVLTGYPADAKNFQRLIRNWNIEWKKRNGSNIPGVAIANFLSEELYQGTKAGARVIGCTIHIIDKLLLAKDHIILLGVDGTHMKVKADAKGQNSQLYLMNLRDYYSKPQESLEEFIREGLFRNAVDTINQYHVYKYTQEGLTKV